MRIDLHNHTTLCNHANGTMEEYIQKAIGLGIDIFGFSEHAPMKNFEDGYRLKLEDKAIYEKNVLDLKMKYAKDIEILLGYEVDFLQGDYILDEIIGSDVDYIIGSVHYLDDWGFDNPAFIKEYEKRDIDTIWQEYFQANELMAKSGKFDIVGHMDLMKVFRFLPKKEIKTLALQTLKTIKKANMVLEINSSGFRKPIKEQYPSQDILEVAYELNIPITFGSDAHSIEQVGLYYEDVVTLAKSIGYNEAIRFSKRDKGKISF
jgi:histidinol-phosphatase (PHP family)